MLRGVAQWARKVVLGHSANKIETTDKPPICLVETQEGHKAGAGHEFPISLVNDVSNRETTPLCRLAMDALAVIFYLVWTWLARQLGVPQLALARVPTRAGLAARAAAQRSIWGSGAFGMDGRAAATASDWSWMVLDWSTAARDQRRGARLLKRTGRAGCARAESTPRWRLGTGRNERANRKASG